MCKLSRLPVVRVHQQRRKVHSLQHNVCNPKGNAGLIQSVYTQPEIIRRMANVALLNFDAVVFIASPDAARLRHPWSL